MSNLVSQLGAPADIQLLYYCFGIAGVFGALIGVAIAAWNLVANRRNQRESNSRKAYYDYIRLGLEYPDFAFPLLSRLDLEQSLFEGNAVRFEKYEWFVSSVIVTAKFMFETSGPRSVWRQNAMLQLAYHWEYLDKFRNKKEYLRVWSRDIGSEFDEAIAFGRKRFVRPTGVRADECSREDRP